MFARFGGGDGRYLVILRNGLNEVERAQLHQDVGEVLEALYGDRAEDIAPQLARHFDEAGIVDKAIGYLQLAGRQAVQRTSNVEAVGFIRRALDLVLDCNALDPEFKVLEP